MIALLLLAQLAVTDGDTLIPVHDRCFAFPCTGLLRRSCSLPDRQHISQSDESDAHLIAKPPTDFALPDCA